MHTSRIVAALVAIAGMSTLASADTVTATFNNVSPGHGGTFSLDSGANYSGFGGAGLFNWTRTGGTYAGLQGNFIAFCTELTEHIGGGGSYTYNVDTLENVPTALGGMGSGKANDIRELFGRYYTPSFSYTLGADEAAAMQMSIWEISHDTSGSYDLTTGNARFNCNSAAAQALAQSYLASIDGTGPHATDLFSLSSNSNQDMIVPSPGSFALLGLGGVMIGRRRR